MKIEMCNPEDCKDGGSLYPSGQLYRRSMTDKEIGKTAREIAEKGFNAIVKKSKNGIIILREKCEIVASEKER